MLTLLVVIAFGVYVGGVVVVGGKVLKYTGKLTAFEITEAVTWPVKLFK